MSSTYDYLMSLINGPETQAGNLPASSNSTYTYLKSLIRPDADDIFKPKAPPASQPVPQPAPQPTPVAMTPIQEANLRAASLGLPFTFTDKSLEQWDNVPDPTPYTPPAEKNDPLQDIHEKRLEQLDEKIGHIDTPPPTLTADDYTKLRFAAAGLPTSLTQQQQASMKQDYQSQWDALNEERANLWGLDDPEDMARYNEVNNQIKQIEAQQQRLDEYGYNQKQNDKRFNLSSVTSAPDFQQTASAAQQTASFSTMLSPGYQWSDKDATAKSYINYIASPEYKAAADAMMAQTRPDETTTRLNYLSPSEKSILFYYAGKGDWKSVKDYVDTISRELGERKQAERDQKQQEFASKHPGLATIESAVVAPFQGLSYIDTGIQKFKNAVTGSYEQTDTNTVAYQPAHIVQDVGKGVLTDANGNEKTGFKKFFWTVMPGAAQFAATLPFGAATSVAILSTEAAGQMALTSQQNGASPQQAFALSTIAGMVSYLTNKIPVNRLFGMLDKGATSFVNGLQRYATQTGLSTGVSLIDTYANTISDDLIMGDKSQLNQLIAQYEKDGLSRDDAARKAITQVYVLNPLHQAGTSAAMAAITSLKPAFHGAFSENAEAQTPESVRNQYLDQFDKLGLQKPAAQTLNEAIRTDWNSENPLTVDDLLRLNEQVKKLNSPNDTQLKLEAGAGQGYNGKDTKAFEAYLSILDDVDQAIKSGMSARDYAISKGVPSSLTDDVAALLDKYNFRMDADPDNRTMSPDELAKAVDDWNGDGGTEGAGETIVGSKYDKIRPTQDIVNPKKVEEYAKRLRAGEKIPPVQVIEVPGKGQYIINGHHRYVASIQTGIPVEIKVVQNQGPIGMPDWSGVQWKEYKSEEQFWGD